MKTYEELRIRMDVCVLQAVRIMLEEGGDLLTILNNRFNIDRGMLERWSKGHGTTKETSTPKG